MIQVKARGQGSTARLHKIRLMIVDDSPEAADGLCSIFRAHQDIEVVGLANNGLDAVIVAVRLKPELILMDAQMPGIDGVEATRRIKARLPQTRVLFLAVHSTHIDAALEAGADGFLMKDSSRQELLNEVRRLACACFD
ncbi:MAG: response regulator transcription factor [Chloroflexi bacterium]|nr:response regulator transcription factor [Chloroflexota bacterium]